jgi:hypothetical protein
MSAYWSELGGILAALYIIHRIFDYYNITTGKATLFCDNKGALTKTFHPIRQGISPFLSSDYDLLQVAKQIISVTPVTIIGTWVKGHYQGKDRKVQHDLNDIADTTAGAHLEAQDGSNRTNALNTSYPGYKIRLMKDDCVITSKYYSTITQHRQDRLIIQYILKKTKWSMRSFNFVNWDAHGTAFRRLTRNRQITTAKLVHNLANTNRQNFLYYQMSPNCPGCRLVEETFEHVLQCTCSQTAEFRQTQLSERRINTPTSVIDAIMHGFQD